MLDRIHAAVREVRRAARIRSTYPASHPSRGDALAMAQSALAGVFRYVDRLELTVSPHGLACNGHELADDDGSLRQIASFLRSHRIGSIAIARGLPDAEADLLLDLVTPHGVAEEQHSIAERLAEADGEYLHIAEIDYEAFVPLSKMPSDQPAGALTGTDDKEAGSWALTTRALESALDAADDEALRKILGDADALAQMLVGCFPEPRRLDDGQRRGGPDPCPEQQDPPANEQPPVDVGEGAADLQASGAALAALVQRLAETACEGRACEPAEVFGQLAAALRQLDPCLLALTFRADVVGRAAPFDALRETARRFTIAEVVRVVCAAPGAIASEPSEVCRRLAARVAAEAERADALYPLLKAALTEGGMSEDVYNTTLGPVLKELANGRGPQEDAVVANEIGRAHV